MTSRWPTRIERVQKHIESAKSGEIILAADVSKKFNFGAPDAASKEINAIPGLRKIGKGVFVKE